MKDIVLTGIKPTGTAHLGNYLGAIKPAIKQANNNNALAYFFIADYHALNYIQDKEELARLTYELASTWLACGLDIEKVVFYKQSDVYQTFELQSVLNNVTPKGLLNRAHAYKAMVEDNVNKGLDQDSNINMGLYNYPILMAADILLFDTKLVPVGQDQKQHVEITRDIAQYFNKKYGNTLVVPEPVIEDKVSTIIGLDGRKMSKSYGNIIPLFCTEKVLQKTINKIVTDSSGVDEPKDTDNNVYKLYKLFATPKELKDFELALSQGIGWGSAKKELFNVINRELAPLREKYNYYMENLHIIDELLQKGAQKARQVASDTLLRVRKAIGVE